MLREGEGHPSFSPAVQKEKGLSGDGTGEEKGPKRFRRGKGKGEESSPYFSRKRKKKETDSPLLHLQVPRRKKKKEVLSPRSG